MQAPPKNEFEQLAAEQTEPGIVREFWDFLREQKKWWLLPIIVVLLALALLVMFGGTAAAPFIYPMFPA